MHKKIAIVGSRRVSEYGRLVIKNLMLTLKDRVEVVTIEVSGCNKEVMKYSEVKVFSGVNFEKLNEEVAEYADSLVIVEGGKNSGTILLASKFVEKNKEVWVVPGRIFDEGSYVANFLIKNGANILVDVSDLTA